MALANKVISIVGCGWLGMALGKELVSHGYTVKGSTTQNKKLEVIKKLGMTPYQMKVSYLLEGDVEGLFECEILVINIPPGRNRKNVEKDHPDEIKLLIEKSKASSVDHIIFISSTGVYQNTGNLVDEEGPCHPDRASGKAILFAEKMVKISDNNWTILRMAGLAGEDREPGRWFAGRKNLPDGDTPVNMIHRDDCIRAIIRVIQDPSNGEVFNLCADVHPAKDEFYRSQAQKINVIPPHFNKGLGAYKIVDNSKFKSAYDFRYDHADPCNF